MRKKVLYIILTILVVSSLSARNDRDTIGAGKRCVFTENLGQWEDNILFRSQMGLATLFVEEDCFTFVVQHPDNINLQHPLHSGNKGIVDRYRTHAYKIHFVGSHAQRVEGDEREEGHENFFIGNDPNRWVSGAGLFQSIVYQEIYHNIDLKVYSATSAMKYDFIVRPGAKPTDITMQYEGTDGLRIENGNLIARTSVLDIVELRPYAYQMEGDRQVEVKAAYRLKGDRVCFEIGNYDTTKTLIIDPYLYFSSYTGSTADNWGTTGCYDSYKNTYTSGVVFGNGYPVSTGAYDGTYNGNCDIGIFKFDINGTQRLYATYLGGSNADMPHSMFVNSLDELVIFGTTGSSDFPVTSGAFDVSFNGGSPLQYEGSSTINFPNGSDLFICRFNSSGSQLQASTFVGGGGNDGLNYRNSFDYSTIMLGNDSLYYNYGDGARGEIITDDLNNIYVGSTTSSINFPVTPGCIQPTNHGRQDGVVFKIDYNLSNMMWCTYLGGAKDDAVYSVDCDKDYNVVVSGGTNSLNFPTTSGSYDQSYNGGSADAFITKISYYGTSMITSTYFGSSAYDQSYFVRCGKSNDIFIFGQTEASGSTLIHNANYNTPGSGQFLARFKTNLDSLVWSTVFGTGDVATNGPNISPTAFAVDICNRLYLSGWGRIFLGRSFGGTMYQWNTHGTTNMTVTPNAYQTTTDGQDFYIMSLDMDANSLVYASYFGEPHNASQYYSGGDHVDGGTSRFDRLGTLYQSVCASCSGGDDFPVTTGAYGQHNNSSNCNNAIFRINLTDDFPVAEFTQPVSGCAPQQITFHNTGRGTSFLWDFGDGTTSTLQNPQHTFMQPGEYRVQLVAYMPGGCRETDTAWHKIMVLGRGTFNLDTLSTCPGTSIQIGMPQSPQFTYHWIQGTVSDPNISNPFVNLPGTYILVISNGVCSDTARQIITPGETEANIVGDTISCSSPMTLNVTPSDAGYTYQWSSSSNLTDTLNSDLHNSQYTFAPTEQQWIYVHVINEMGCYKTDSIHIHFYNIVDSLTIEDPLCPDSCNGSAKATVTSFATPPIQYDWGNGLGYSDSINNLCHGNHQVVIRDASGCHVTTPFVVNNPLPPTVVATIQHIHCHEYCTGTIDLAITGSSTYSILWLDDSSTGPNRNGLCPGNYIYQIIDANGCIFGDTITILENVDISINATTLSNTCPDECNGKASVTITGGTPPFTYLWSSGEQTPTAQLLCEGLSTVMATDASGCVVSDSVNIEVQHSFDNVHAWADNYLIFDGQSTTLHVTPIQQGSYWWSPSDHVDNPSSTDPVATLLDTTLFTVTVTDSIGCQYSDTVEVICVTINCGEPNIFIPNAFTPNGDGKNDMLCFRGEWISDFNITIFTRWGEKVYESNDINDCWDGQFRNNWCMPGVYVYHCRITCDNGEVTNLKGDITLIR